MGDIRHPIFKINKNSKWANKTSLKQNNITDQSLTGNSLKGSELIFKDKILSNFQITISKQTNNIAIHQNNKCSVSLWRTLFRPVF